MWGLRVGNGFVATQRTAITTPQRQKEHLSVQRNTAKAD